MDGKNASSTAQGHGVTAVTSNQDLKACDGLPRCLASRAGNKSSRQVSGANRLVLVIFRYDLQVSGANRLELVKIQVI